MITPIARPKIRVAPLTVVAHLVLRAASFVAFDLPAELVLAGELVGPAVIVGFAVRQPEIEVLTCSVDTGKPTRALRRVVAPVIKPALLGLGVAEVVHEAVLISGAVVP